MKIFLDLILLAFTLYVLSCVRLQKDSPSSFDTNIFLPIRAVAAFGVIFCHGPRYISHIGTKLFTHLEYTGVLFVSLFFAFSGYGLARSYALKGERYLDGFLKKRLTALLCPLLSVIPLFFVLYAGEALQTGTSISEDFVQRMIAWFRDGSTYVMFSWYVETVAVLYLFFYLARRLFKNNTIAVYAVLLVGMAAFIALLRTLNYGEYWYNSMSAFLVGMLWADFSDHPFLKKATHHFILAELVLVLFFGITWLLRFRTAGLTSLCFTLVSCCFPPLILFVALSKVYLKSKLLDYLGTRSYEIYLVQGIAFALSCEPFLNIPDGPLRLLFVLLGSAVLGSAVYCLDQKIIHNLLRSGTARVKS